MRMNPADFQRLEKYAGYCQISKSEYIRLIINRYRPKIPPLYHYYEMTKELKAIGNNLNQIAREANETGYVDAWKYKEIAQMHFEKLAEIEQAVTGPEKLKGGTP